MFRQVVIYLLSLSSIVLAQYTPLPRWAQAAALLESTLYVHGGRSDPFNSYSYSSAPEISDLLVLDLSASFNSSSPPWQIFHSNSSPALAWHTLSAFNPTELLLFGGQPGPNFLTALTTLNDSAGLLSTSSKSGPSFLMQPQNWANEPMRRIRHSTSFASGKIWLIGGEKADGSGNAFNGHYSFNPSSLEFVQLLPSPGAPPDIYGHASLVLPDGRLLVLGGYCASCSNLVPMSTVWSLDTTQNPPVWEKLSVSMDPLPGPRRDFAAVVLSNGQVLIHGGGDAQLQTTYSDGWILDTGQNPMIWMSVAALAQLGQRKDHLAVQAGGYVLFCFGYGSSAPASASLFIYNPMTSSMVSFYNAPTAGSWPAVTSLPPPTKTGSEPSSEGGTGTTPGDSPSTTSHTSGEFSASSTPTIAIALGTTFGFLGLVAGGLAVMYYTRRVRDGGRKPPWAFSPLKNDPEFSPTEGSVGGTVPEAEHFGQINERASGIGINSFFAHLGITTPGSIAHKPRRDMFVDEDRSFRFVGDSNSVQGQDSERASIWSLRSVSALVRGVIGSEPSGSSADQREHEKIDHLRNSDGGQESSIRPGSLHGNYSSSPAHQNNGSFWSYTDPFEDPVDDDYDDPNLPRGIPEKNADYNHIVLRSDEANDFGWSALGHQDSAWPSSVRSHLLTPLREVSHTSLTDRSNSLPSGQESPYGQTAYSHADNSVTFPQASISPNSPPTTHSSDLQWVTSISRHSILSSPTLSHSHSISRPDSWWSRLTKPPLLDRRTSITTPRPLDFRDPTPAPPIATFEKTKEPPSTLPHSNDTPGGHGKSLSSAYSGRTANTDRAEHLGGRYDVVQRLATDGSSSQRAPSLGSAELTEQGMLFIDKPAPMSGSLPHVDPPQSTSPQVEPTSPLDMVTPIDPLVGSITNAASPKKGVVSSIVTAYECRLSQELESQQIPTTRNTRHREEVPSRSRPTIRYGVAPHPSLFITNPDLGHIS